MRSPASRKEYLSKVIAEGLDKLATLDFHGRGIVKPIYDAARQRQGGDPLTYIFARDLIQQAVRGGTIALATGFMIRRAMQPETDGLTGTAYLAFVLSEGLGLNPVLICEKGAVRAVKASLEATGLEAKPLLENSTCKNGLSRGQFMIVPFPTPSDEGAASGHENALESLISLGPCAFVTIERPGKNANGIPHTTFGASMSDISADIDSVMGRIKESGNMTFAVGDMGNELGMGLVSDIVGSITPFGRKCACECGGGVAAIAKADRVMMGSISDDACYALGAAVAEQLGRMDLLPEVGFIEQILKEAVSAGAVDGITAENRLSIDMVPWKAHGSVIELIRELVLKAHGHDAARPQFIDKIMEQRN